MPGPPDTTGLQCFDGAIMKPVYSLFFALIFSAIGGVNADEPPVVTAELKEGAVTVMFPTSAFKLGYDQPFKVLVKPAADQLPPATVRGRFGMPDMGHWVTDEQAQPFSDNGMEFVLNDIHHTGVYRFRIWLDYADGHQTKTAVDFKIMSDQGLDPEVVQDQ